MLRALSAHAWTAGAALLADEAPEPVAPPPVASERDARPDVEPGARPTLGLETVLASVRSEHPLLDAADASIDAAKGRQLSARGAFDPRIRARAYGTPVGYYRYGVVDTEVRAQTLAFGMVAFAGWRLGRGNIPIYDGRLVTADAGEVRAGIELPLLRGGIIDGARANRRKADIDADIAELERSVRALELARDAALSYWDWVAASGRLLVRARQLELARARDAGLRRQIAEGNVAGIEATDNARVIATREAVVVNAERDVKVTGLGLSMFLRDRRGRPLAPDDFAPPGLVLPPRLADTELTRDVGAAHQRRPDLEIAALRIQVVDVDIRVARNARLPSLGAQAYAAKDIGDGPASITPAEVGVGLALELPIPLRTARGELATATAQSRRLTEERRFLRDRVEVEVRSAHAEMSASRRRAQIAGRQADLAETLAEAERSRLGLGDSNILVVNLREEAAADAAASAIDAIADYRKARARYQVATGVLPTR